MAETGLPVICIETRHAKAFLEPQVDRSGCSDDRRIAHMARVNLIRPAHVKTLATPEHPILIIRRTVAEPRIENLRQLAFVQS
jgi:transposase